MFEWFGRVSFCPHTKIADFARHLKDGRLMGSRCSTCGSTSFPPRADCAECLGSDFEYVEISGRGTLLTYTHIDAAPAGFEDLGAYTIGVIDLVEGGRLLAPFGESVTTGELEIGMPLQAVPRIYEEMADIHVYYSLERPGTTWVKSPETRTGGAA